MRTSAEDSEARGADRTAEVTASPGGAVGPGPESAMRRAYDVLKREILTCIIPPGTPLYEGQEADRLRMSKTPVREALGLLVQEGFVEVRPRQGYRVTDLSLADIQEVFHLRQLLEPAAAELAAQRANADQLRHLREMVDRVGGGAIVDENERARIDTEFHLLLAEASGSQRLASAIRRLQEEMERLAHLGLSPTDSSQIQASEHRALLDALLIGNHHLAWEIAAGQVESSRRRALDTLLSATASTSSMPIASHITVAAPSPPDPGRRDRGGSIGSPSRRESHLDG